MIRKDRMPKQKMTRATLKNYEQIYLASHDKNRPLVDGKTIDTNTPTIETQHESDSKPITPEHRQIKAHNDKIIAVIRKNPEENQIAQKFNETNIEKYNAFQRLVEKNEALLSATRHEKSLSMLAIYKQRQSEGHMLSVIDQVEMLQLLAEAVAKFSLESSNQVATPQRSEVLLAIYNKKVLGHTEKYPPSYECLEDEEDETIDHYQNNAYTNARAQIIDNIKDLLRDLHGHEDLHLRLLNEHIENDKFEQSFKKILAESYHDISEQLRPETESELPIEQEKQEKALNKIIQALGGHDDSDTTSVLEKTEDAKRIDTLINQFEQEINRSTEKEAAAQIDHKINTITSGYAHGQQSAMLLIAKHNDVIENMMNKVKGLSKDAILQAVQQNTTTEITKLLDANDTQTKKLINLHDNSTTPESSKENIKEQIKKLELEKTKLYQLISDVAEAKKPNDMTKLMSKTIPPKGKEDSLDRLKYAAKTFNDLKPSQQSARQQKLQQHSVKTTLGNILSDLKKRFTGEEKRPRDDPDKTKSIKKQ